MNDQNAGMGGSYIINGMGERELVERTSEAAPPDPGIDAPPAATASEKPTKPAKAVFFTPVTPVAPDDTTTTTTE